MLANEEKKVIAEKMGWEEPSTIICNNCGEVLHAFDLNDASLVMEELMKQGKFVSFEMVAMVMFKETMQSLSVHGKLIPWLMTMQNGEAINFFRAYYQWVKET